MFFRKPEVSLLKCLPSGVGFSFAKFRVFVLMELIISLFPLLPDVSCLPPSLLLALPFVSGLFPGSGKCQTSVSPLPTGCTTVPQETLEILAPWGDRFGQSVI